MDQPKRLILAIALSFGITFIFSTFVWKQPIGAPAAQTDAGVVVADAAPVALPALPTATPPPPSDLPQRTLDVARPSIHYRFTTDGAGLTAAVLQGRREHEPIQLSFVEGYRALFGRTLPTPRQVDMAQSGEVPQFAISVLGDAPLAPRTRYAVANQGPGKLEFATTSGAWRVTKKFSWPTTAAATDDDPSGYFATLEIELANISSTAATGTFKLETRRQVNPAEEQAPSMFAGIGNQTSVLCQLGDTLERHVPVSGSGCSSGPPPTAWDKPGAVRFVGLDHQYFLSAIWPQGSTMEGKCDLTATHLERIATIEVPLNVPPGTSFKKAFDLYLGPKDFVQLERVQGLTPAPAPDLTKTVDFGYWAVIAKVLNPVLRFLHRVTGNWGLAIILLTVVVKIVMLPLTHRMMVSAEKMKKLQPRMAEIKKRYPDDKEKQNQEMIRLYQEEKMNPFGGCLAMLVQLPIWGGLFTTLRTSYEIYSEPFLIWNDLTTKDPTYLLPILLAVTMIATQRLQPQVIMDSSQAFMMTWIMPVVFAWLMFGYPAGLVLYMITNSLLSIAQQMALRRYLQRKEAAAPA